MVHWAVYFGKGKITILINRNKGLTMNEVFHCTWGSKNMFSFFRPKNLTDFMLPISYLLKTKNWSLTPKITSTPQINIRGNLKINILVQNDLVIFNLTIAHTEEKN